MHIYIKKSTATPPRTPTVPNYPIFSKFSLFNVNLSTPSNYWNIVIYLQLFSFIILNWENSTSVSYKLIIDSDATKDWTIFIDLIFNRLHIFQTSIITYKILFTIFNRWTKIYPFISFFLLGTTLTHLQLWAIFIDRFLFLFILRYLRI